MKAIYNQIIERLNYMKENSIPISDISHEYKFVPVEPLKENQFYQAELVDGEEKIIIRIWGSDHSGELEYRKDTYHNEIEYIDAHGMSKRVEYMYLAD